MAPKAIVAALWIWGGVSLWMPTSQLAFAVGRRVFWFLLIAHVIECVIFLPRLRGAGGSLPAHLLQTLVFGIAHVRTLGGQPAA